jgi:tRNA(Leu) C34 or U34 (ribose-2'-O)-methylase TrmL
MRCGFVEFIRAMRYVASVREQTRIGLDYWTVVCATGHMSSTKEKLLEIFGNHVNTGE